MNSLLRASVTAVLALPPTLPASAAPASGPLTASRIGGSVRGPLRLIERRHRNRRRLRQLALLEPGLRIRDDTIALGNGYVYGFYNGAFIVGNGSYALRSGNLQFTDGPSGSSNPIGSACAEGFCWYTDSGQDQLIFANGNANSVNLGYSPAGLAIDVPHNRLYIAGPTHNEIHFYNLATPALEKTLQ